MDKKTNKQKTDTEKTVFLIGSSYKKGIKSLFLIVHLKKNPKRDSSPKNQTSMTISSVKQKNPQIFWCSMLFWIPLIFIIWTKMVEALYKIYFVLEQHEGEHEVNHSLNCCSKQVSLYIFIKK